MDERQTPEIPALSNKQTPADLQAALAELDKLDPNAPDPDMVGDPGVDDPVVVDEPVTPAADYPDQKEDAEDEEPVVTPAADDPDPKEKVPDKKEDDDKNGKKEIDYHERYSESSAEARIIEERNRTYLAAVDAAENLPEPSDDECRAEYGDAWDDKDDMDKKMAKQVLHDKRYKEKIREARKNQQSDIEYTQKVQAFAVDPENIKQYPFLEGREVAFAEFASKPTRRGLDLDFVAEVFKSTRAARPKAPKGSLIPRATTSTNKAKPSPTKLDASKARVLRTVDQRAYNNAIRDGKLNPADLLQ